MYDLTSLIDRKIDDACHFCDRDHLYGVLLIGNSPLMWHFYHVCSFRGLDVKVFGLENYDTSQKWYEIGVDELLSLWNVS